MPRPLSRMVTSTSSPAPAGLDRNPAVPVHRVDGVAEQDVEKAAVSSCGRQFKRRKRLFQVELDCDCACSRISFVDAARVTSDSSSLMSADLTSASSRLTKRRSRRVTSSMRAADSWMERRSSSRVAADAARCSGRSVDLAVRDGDQGLDRAAQRAERRVDLVAERRRHLADRDRVLRQVAPAVGRRSAPRRRAPPPGARANSLRRCA